MEKTKLQNELNKKNQLKNQVENLFHQLVGQISLLEDLIKEESIPKDVKEEIK